MKYCVGFLILLASGASVTAQEQQQKSGEFPPGISNNTAIPLSADLSHIFPELKHLQQGSDKAPAIAEGTPCRTKCHKTSSLCTGTCFYEVKGLNFGRMIGCASMCGRAAKDCMTQCKADEPAKKEHQHKDSAEQPAAEAEPSQPAAQAVDDAVANLDWKKLHYGVPNSNYRDQPKQQVPSAEMPKPTETQWKKFKYGMPDVHVN